MKKILIFSAVLSLTAVGVNAAMPYKPGDIADDFSLKNLSGSEVSLSGIPGAKGFIVVFMCNTCPMVKAYEERIKDLDAKFSPKGYPVVAINANDRSVSPGDSYSEMQKLAKTKGYKFEYLYDESQEVARKYGATNTPHVYVLAREGDNLRVKYAGAIDNNSESASAADRKYVEDAVNALMNDEKVPVVSTKAIGCGIKWKKS